MKTITINRSDGSTYEIKFPPEFHEIPYNELSIECEEPKNYINSLIEKYENLQIEINKDERLFPGDTNFVGNSLYELSSSIKDVLYHLKMIHHKSQDL